MWEDAPGALSESPPGRPHLITCANCLWPRSEITHANWETLLDLEDILLVDIGGTLELELQTS